MNFSMSASTEAVNSVLRNTYMLLSVTLGFSALMSFVTIDMQMTFAGAVAGVVGSFGLLLLLMLFKNSILALPIVFAFTGTMGAFMGPAIGQYLAMENGATMVLTAMGLTSMAFVGISAYAIVSKKDFSYMHGFLFAGLLVLIAAMLLNFFFQIPALDLVISVVAVFIFSALILFDTSLIVNGGERNYVMATVSLYLDIINLFLHILNILASSNK